MQHTGGKDAVQLQVAEKYLDGFSKLARESTTVLLPANPGGDFFIFLCLTSALPLISTPVLPHTKILPALPVAYINFKFFYFFSACMPRCAHTHICGCMCTHKHTHTHIRMYVHIHTCTHSYGCMCVCIHTHIHTHTHTHTQTQGCMCTYKHGCICTDRQ